MDLSFHYLRKQKMLALVLLVSLFCTLLPNGAQADVAFSLSGSNFVKTILGASGSSWAYTDAGFNTRGPDLSNSGELQILSKEGDAFKASYISTSGSICEGYIPVGLVTTFNANGETKTSSGTFYCLNYLDGSVNSSFHVDKGDRVQLIATYGSWVQILYPTSGSYYRLAWASKSDYDRYCLRTGPIDDPFPPKGNDLLSVAKSQIGYKGSSTSSNLTGANVTSVGNYTKYGAYTGTNGLDWCASFVAWCGKQAGETAIKNSALAGPDSLCYNARTKGGVVYFNAMNSSQQANHAYLETYAILGTRGDYFPSPGDLIFFRWNSAGSSVMFSHVGIVSQVSGGTVYFIDGNGSGDVVKERSVSITSTDIAAFCKLHGSFVKICSHLEKKWVTTLEPTTVRIGTAEYRCTNCGATIDTKMLAAKPDVSGYTGQTISPYDASKGDLTITWNNATGASRYRVRVISMNEKPIFTGEGSNNQPFVDEVFGKDGGTVTNTSRSITIPSSYFNNAQYLKVAIASENSYGDLSYTVFGVELLRPTPTCNHNYHWQTVRAATATQEGEEMEVCAKCGNIRAHRALPIPSPVNSAQLTATASPMQADGTFTVTLRITKNPGFSSIKVYFNCSSNTVLINDNATTSTGIATGYKPTVGKNKNMIAIVNINGTNITGDGTFANVSFNASQIKDSVLNITAEAFDENRMTVPINGYDLTVSYSPRLPGDADKDGHVDLRDAIYIIQYDCDWDVDIDLSNADVDGIPGVDLRDAILIIQKDCDWDVELR